MDGESDARVPFSIWIMKAAAIVVPALAVVALLVAFGSPTGATAPATTPRAGETSAAADSPGVAVASPARPPPEASPRASVAPVSVSKARPKPAAGDPAGEPEPLSKPAAHAGPSNSKASKTRVSRAPSPIVWVRAGERIQILDAPRGEVVAKQDDETEFGSPSVFSVRRWTGRWVGVSTPLVPNGRLGWIRVDPRKLRTGSVDYAVVVDLSRRTAKLLRGGKVIRSWSVTVGAVGSETPTGTFAVTDTFRGGLNPAYGCCALALSATQPSLPSGWLGGDRIALHGTGGPLGVAASHGCVRSADRDVSVLVSRLPLATPVRIHR